MKLIPSYQILMRNVHEDLRLFAVPLFHESFPPKTFYPSGLPPQTLSCEKIRKSAFQRILNVPYHIILYPCARIYQYLLIFVGSYLKM